MSADAAAAHVVREMLAEVLPDLPDDWPSGAPLTDAGLDSVAVLGLCAAIESRGVALADEDLDARHFATIDALAGLLSRRGAAR